MVKRKYAVEDSLVLFSQCSKYAISVYIKFSLYINIHLLIKSMYASCHVGAPRVLYSGSGGTRT